ncbi:hypothetical protein GCM10023204_25140 [Actinomycetospora succinea]
MASDMNSAPTRPAATISRTNRRCWGDPLSLGIRTTFRATMSAARKVGSGSPAHRHIGHADLSINPQSLTSDAKFGVSLTDALARPPSE